MAVQSDSKVVGFGVTPFSSFAPGLDVIALRLTSAGSLDSTFGSGGIVRKDMGSTPYAIVHDFSGAVTLQSDGKVLLTGFSELPASNGYIRGDILRLTSTGSFDTSFGGGSGTVQSTLPPYQQARFSEVLQQSNGRLVAVGQVYPCAYDTCNPDPSYTAVGRFLANGSLDTSFGNAGMVVLDSASNATAALQPDDKILLCNSGSLWRYNADGSVDASFGTGGVVQTNDLCALALQPDGKIVVAGSVMPNPHAYGPSLAIARYDSDGTLDQSFGTAGTTINAIGVSISVRRVARQADGKLIVVGEGELVQYGTTQCLLARYQANGRLDSSFGNGGYSANVFSGNDTYIDALALEPDGHIVASGQGVDAGDNDVGLIARFDNSICGNGVLESGEQCEDGNLVNGDGCDMNCTSTACGNGIQTAGEACDDGNLTSGDGCDANCRPTGCGNGIRTGSEVCDDGNLTDGDGCDSNCRPTGCGNGVVTAGETCDDGNLTSGDGCDANCSPTSCGNGIRTGTEECDDGNNVDGDGCEADCTITPEHDTFLLPVAPVSITIAAGKTSASKIIHGTVLNADVLPVPEQPGHSIALDASTDCPGASVSVPDFDSKTAGAQNHVTLAGGKSKAASIVLTVASPVASFNHVAPLRCSLTLSATTSAPASSIDPQPSNNQITVDVSIVDKNVPEQQTLHESVIRAISPLKVTIMGGHPELDKKQGLTIVNGDLLPASQHEQHQITVNVFDGTCPSGTVGLP
ncbi:MAG TPA: DUF4215 domain-containing protein, partial [Candidatus Acidoferrales bacterium]|nr:DUF4215 domain-containing protein [Candidatus Acidoferrales bacterium]